MTVRECIKKTEKELIGAGVQAAETEALQLASFVFKKDRLHLLLSGNEEAGAGEQQFLSSMAEERKEGRPIQYILGSADFMGLEFFVDERVLIPRPETEELTQLAMEWLENNTKGKADVLDLCTGSGAVGVSVAALTDAAVCLSDISRDALEVAEFNASKLCPRNMPRIVRSDLFSEITEENPFDLILSNPPYIAPEVIETLQREVKDHEPRLALDGGRAGLELIEKITAQAPRHLKNGTAALIMEIGHDQGPAAERLAVSAGFSKVRIIKDLNGLDRILFAEKNK